MRIGIAQVSNAELGQLRPPSEADIRRNIERAGWDTARMRNSERLLTELSRRARQFVQMQRNPERQQAQSQQPRAQHAVGRDNRDRPAPAATPRHQPVTQDGYGQARGRTITEPRMHQPSIAHLPANVQQAMLRNQQRDARQQEVRQSMQQLTDRARGAMRALGNTALGRTQTASHERAQRAGLQQLQAKNATQKRVERQAEKAPTLFDKYVGKPAARQQEQQRGKEQERGRDRGR